MSSEITRVVFRALLRESTKFSDGLHIKLPVGQTAWRSPVAFFDRAEEYQARVLSRVLPEATKGLHSTTVSLSELHAHIKSKFREHASIENLGQRQDLAFQALRELGSQLQMASCSSTTTTRGVCIVVTSAYAGVAAGAAEGKGQHMYQYRCTIKNVGRERVWLQGRHWVITDSHGVVHAEVPKGSPGVVGYTPDLQPGAVFEYLSWTSLNTPSGLMQGSFQMAPLDERDRAGPLFDALIHPFRLIADQSDS